MVFSWGVCLACSLRAQGLEAGGHRGSFLSNDINQQMGTFAFVSQLVSKVNVPVIAAGGIASAEGVAAAMRLVLLVCKSARPICFALNQLQVQYIERH